ncbi:MAG: PAS domain S-box protein, partial [Nitriliruptoraceae bacterium]
MLRAPTGARPRPLRRWWVAVLVYVAVGLVWVIAGDAILFTTQEEPRWFSLVKGIFYVLLTGAVAAGVLVRSHRRLDRTLGELSAREAELALLGAHAQDLLYRIELVPVLRIAFVSDSAERIVGYAPQELYEDPDLARRLVHPEDRHLLRDLAAMDGTVRLRWVHRDGRVVWCEQQNRVQIEDGQAVSLVGVGRDITAEVLRNGVARATAQLSGEVLEGEAAFEEALERALRTLRQLFEAASVSVEIAAGGRGCRGHGLEADGPGPTVLPGKSLAAAHDATRVRVVTAVASPEPSVLEELLGVVAERIDTVHGAAGRDWELRQLEQALESSASGVMLTDRDGRVEWVNRAFTTITGYDASEVIGQLAGLVFDGVDGGFATEQAAAIASGRSFAGGVVHRRRDGTRYTASVALDPVLDREGEPAGFVTILRDVTADEQEREKVRQRELEALARWQEIERDRSLLVQTISHELRTPLTVVLGAAETLSAREVNRARREELSRALARAKREVLGRLDVLLAATD